MNIKFRTTKLEKQYQDHRKATKAYGHEVARKYIQRVAIIKSAREIEVLKRMPALRCHQLKGKLKNKWAMNLTDYYRLIFTLQGDSLQIVCIEEVSKHYDD